jgi:hypothetical protein
MGTGLRPSCTLRSFALPLLITTVLLTTSSRLTAATPVDPPLAPTVRTAVRSVAYSSLASLIAQRAHRHSLRSRM